MGISVITDPKISWCSATRRNMQNGIKLMKEVMLNDIQTTRLSDVLYK